MIQHRSLPLAGFAASAAGFAGLLLVSILAMPYATARFLETACLLLCAAGCLLSAFALAGARRAAAGREASRSSGLAWGGLILALLPLLTKGLRRLREFLDWLQIFM
jgi:hypothetical protein